MREALINRNGLWSFAHDYFRQAVQQSYLPTVTNQQAAHRHLALSTRQKFRCEFPKQ